MQAGKLNQRLIFYQPQQTKSRSGAPITELKKAFRASAELLDGQASETSINDTHLPHHTCRFRLRWRRITHNSWFTWRGRAYRVSAVDDTDPKRQSICVTGEANPSKPPPSILE